MRGDTNEGRAALEVRVSTQTVYLMEMMRRLGIDPHDAADEAEHAAQAFAESLCVTCEGKALCAQFLTEKVLPTAPPFFCINSDYVAARKKS